MLKELKLYDAISGDKGANAPKVTRYVTPHMQWTIGIGKDHHATVTMGEDDYQALNDIADKNKYGDNYSEAIGWKRDIKDIKDEDKYYYFWCVEKYPLELEPFEILTTYRNIIEKDYAVVAFHETLEKPKMDWEYMRELSLKKSE